HFHDTAFEPAVHLEPGVAEDTQHRAVLREHLGDELLDAGVGSVHRQTLEQAHPDATTLQLVTDGERDLGAPRVAQLHVARQRGDLAGCALGEERQALRPRAVDVRIDGAQIDGRRTLESQVTALRRQAVEELDERTRVGGHGGPQSERRAVAEDHVLGPGPRELDRHAASLREICSEQLRADPRAGCGELRVRSATTRRTLGAANKEATMNTILLATDGSPSALEATREAIRLADELNARLLIVGVEHVTVPAYGYYGYGEVYNDLLSGEHVHVQRVLADAAHEAE